MVWRISRSLRGLGVIGPRCGERFVVTAAGMFMTLLWAVIYLGVAGQSTALEESAEPTMERGFNTPGAEPAV